MTAMTMRCEELSQPGECHELPAVVITLMPFVFRLFIISTGISLITVEHHSLFYKCIHGTLYCKSVPVTIVLEYQLP